MITKSDLEKIDSQEMYKVYDKWPEIARQSYNSSSEAVGIGKVSHIVFAGMGGSGTLGDVFAAILSKTGLHVNVVKGYLLPKSVDSETLVVVTSVSGNTDETLSVLDSAKNLGCKTIAFASGGKIEEFCHKNDDILFQKIQEFHSPRASFVSFLYSMIHVLEPIISVKKDEVENSILELEETKSNISSDNMNASNESLNLALALDGTPLIYYPWGLQAVAFRFRNSLQENAKMHAIVEDVIEASHNGIVAWEKKSDMFPILLQGKDDYAKTKERWKIFKTYFENNGIIYKEIMSVDGDILSKIAHLVYVLDYASVYRAVLSETDPTHVKSIDFVKSKLK